MIITVLECQPDGTQALKQQEVPDTWFDGETQNEPTEAEDTAALLVDHEYRMTLLELGITE